MDKMTLSRTSSFESIEPSRSRGLLFVFLLLACALHWILMKQKWVWFPATPPPRVDLQEISPEQLKKLKSKWKEKSLLIDRTPKPKTETQAPDDARYFSDRNIRVEREQRAKDFSPTVQPLGKEATQGSRSKTKQRPLPSLKDLGLPLFAAGQRKPAHEQTSTQGRDLGGHQYIADQQLPQGSENLLNAKESVYYSFYSRIYDSVGPLWQSKTRVSAPATRLLEGDYATVVDVVLDEKGNLVGVNLVKSSGVTLFDEIVNDCWKKLAKFPNPPKGLLNSDRQIHMGWTFTVRISKGMFFNAPDRNY